MGLHHLTWGIGLASSARQARPSLLAVSSWTWPWRDRDRHLGTTARKAHRQGPLHAMRFNQPGVSQVPRAPEGMAFSPVT